MQQSAPVVIAEERKTKSGHVLGVLTLYKPKALNALDLPMASILLDTLEQWKSRQDITCIVLTSAGDKAFCAGGDIVSMYHAMCESQGEIPAFLTSFFKTEYTLDYCIHYYPKPIVVWGSGIVMGGGMGLLCGASHKVVTETSRLAMPEISIGLYPDVGGSYFLPRMPGKTGLFLGLTATQMNGADAVHAGLADYLVAANQLDILMQKLNDVEWGGVNHHDSVSQVLANLDAPLSPPNSLIALHQNAINTWCDGKTVAAVVDNILNAQESDLPVSEDPEAHAMAIKWLNKAQKNLKNGSPITAHLVFEQCVRGAMMTLAECFKMEAVMSCRCGESGEFQEGVRALLIDKDLSPKWKYNHVEEVPHDVVEGFFSSPWAEDEHPLAHLGEEK